MTWRLPDTYHSAGNGRGTATLKFYEGRDNLEPAPVDRLLVAFPSTVTDASEHESFRQLNDVN
jgi:hypothetical protein